MLKKVDDPGNVKYVLNHFFISHNLKSINVFILAETQTNVQICKRAYAHEIDLKRHKHAIHGI